MITCLECLHYTAGPLNLLSGTDNFGKTWSACGKSEIQYTELKTNKHTYNCMYNHTSAFLYVVCKDNKKGKGKGLPITGHEGPEGE